MKKIKINLGENHFLMNIFNNALNFDSQDHSGELIIAGFVNKAFKKYEADNNCIIPDENCDEIADYISKEFTQQLDKVVAKDLHAHVGSIMLSFEKGDNLSKLIGLMANPEPVSDTLTVNGRVLEKSI